MRELMATVQHGTQDVILKSAFRVSRFGFRVSNFGFWVSGFGFLVSGFGIRALERVRGGTDWAAGETEVEELKPCTRKVDVRLPGKTNPNFHGARPVR